jgi:hypothetical protein
MEREEFETLTAGKSLSEKDNSVLAEWTLATHP